MNHVKNYINLLHENLDTFYNVNNELSIKQKSLLI